MRERLFDLVKNIFSVNIDQMNIIFCVLLLFSAIVNAAEVALTFDDCPRRTGSLMTGMARAEKLVKALKEAGVPQVAFFCNSPDREKDGWDRVKYFADAGHLIANHSADHPRLRDTPTTEYLQGIDRADRELSKLPNFRKWFRFPYLDEGGSPEQVLEVRRHLQATGYMNGYVTIDNADYYIDDLFGKAVSAGKKVRMRRLCSTYKKIMREEAEFTEAMALRALGRSVKHVFLMHETDLNALCIKDLVVELRRRGWKIISPDEAYRDPIAKAEPKETSKLNQGRVFALAQEAGDKGPFYSKWNEESAIRQELRRAKVW